MSDPSPIAVGYARIVASGGTPLVSGRFSFASNTTEPVAASLATETVLDLRGSDSVAIGIALVNPNSRLNVIELSAQDAAGKILRQATVSLQPGMHLSKYVWELLSMDRMAVAIRCQAKLPFALVSLEISHGRVRLIPTHHSDPSNQTTVFPHFVVNSDWGTELVLSNPSNSVMTGLVQIKSSNGEPMLVTIDGKTATEFPYTIAAGGTAVLATRRPVR